MIGNNSSLERIRHLCNSTFIMLRERLDRQAVSILCIGEMQRIDEIGFRDMIKARDVRKRHPGSNGANIFMCRKRVLLLKVMNLIYCHRH